MIRAHVAALAAVLEAHGVTVYDSEAGRKVDGSEVAPDFPYVVLSVTSPVRTTEHFTHERERNELDVMAGYHGLTPASARWVAEHVAALAGAVLPVAGWDARVESSPAGSPLLPDRDDPKRVVWSGYDGFTVVSYPA